MRPLEGLSACRLAEAAEAVLEPEVVAKVCPKNKKMLQTRQRSWHSVHERQGSSERLGSSGRTFSPLLYKPLLDFGVKC